MNRPEILAPAGGEEQLKAAVRCGANAVYLGTKNFNARNAAANFGNDELKSAVSYCHARNVKVYITMNTLITDSEIDDVICEIEQIAQSGADAVIIQDLAVANLWKKYCPEMRLHASTQMTIHNVSGAKEAEKLGFKRLVLARELSLSEIKKISENVNAEIEVFVHGALCMSVSGTCLLSSMIGARSGNRGRCAQPCRLNFKCNGREYALSLKDLSLIDELEKLKEAGVTSFKIEGRMKRPEYVAAAVTAVKNALNKKDFDAETLKAVFSRSGFTKGYLYGKRDINMFGYRRHEDVTAANDVLGKLRMLYKDEIKAVPVNIDFAVTENESKLTVTDGTKTVSVSGDIPSEAKTLPLSEEYAKKCLLKTGGTIFYPDNFDFSINGNVTLSASQMNAMRRKALEKLYEERAKVKQKHFIKERKEKILFGARCPTLSYRLRFERFNCFFDDERADKIILPMKEILLHQDELASVLPKLVCELPFLVFPDNEEKFNDDLIKLKSLGIKEVSADNIGTLAKARDIGFIVHGGHGLNILNKISLREYKELGSEDITLSPEISIRSINSLSAESKIGLLGYGFLPLMRFRACPASTEYGCKNCKGFTKITDRLGTDFYIICSEKKYSSLLNSVPVYIGDKPLPDIDFVTLYFTFESKENSKKIFDAFYGKQSLNMKKTGGLYYRELL